MASSTQSAGSSRDHRPANIGGMMKYSHQSSSSSASVIDTMALPQCKVKRNYACSKCAYYTQNPRSFLHHQKNVHAERLKVYECSHCLYASKHSQKLQRHMQMVHHVPDKKNNANDRDYGNDKPLLVPPVRIRVQRVENHAEQRFGELVIVEDVDVIEAQENEMVNEEANGSSDDASRDQEETVITVGPDGDDDDDDNDDDDGDGDDDEDDDDDDDDDDDGDGDGDDDEEGEEGDGEEGEDGDNVDKNLPEILEYLPLKPPSPTGKRLDQLTLLQHLQKQRIKSPPRRKPSVTKPAFIRCSVCPFGSHSQTLVNRHEKTAHLKKKFFRCMKCNYVTHMRARYTKHVKYHTMPMIKCDDCDFRTPYKWNLDRHNRNHSTTAPGTYKCLHCSFSADIKQSLTVHETNHHVPPVGSVYPLMTNNRRRYRVGASDAPGSSVDGTEIVTYETTKDGGIVEIMTETKSTAQPATANVGSSSKAITTSVTTTVMSSGHNGSAVVNNTVPSTSAVGTIGTTGTTITTTRVMKPAGLKIVSLMNAAPLEATSTTREEKVSPCRRPLPRLIPIVDQQQQQQPTSQRRASTVIRMRQPVSPSSAYTVMGATNPTAAKGDVDDNYYNVAAGQSALSDFASLIDDRDGAAVAGTFNRDGDRGIITATANAAADGPPSSGNSPKSKVTSFFDKLKAKVDETADLTCQVCRYESKCLSEFMRHQRTHNNDNDNDNSIAARQPAVRAANPTTLQQRPPVTAAELKSTRCQRCRKRCKTSTELMAHLATCRGIATAATVVNNNTSRPAAEESEVTRDQETKPQQHHPMENKIFVWNTALVPTSMDEITVTPIAEVSKIKTSPAKRDQEDEEKEKEKEKENDDDGDDDDGGGGGDDDDDDDEDEDDEEIQRDEVYPPPSADSPLLQKPQQGGTCRKDGKMYKTVFKCPHCTFWAATASRFHVHIVGHLNRKPFECSCCAYRSNWRWDITKHIRLKSARKGGSEESAIVANCHQSAKVLMTDETGRRNYSKYNRYLTVLEMDVADGADKAAGGECEDGKGVATKKVVGGGVPRKRRSVVKSNGSFGSKGQVKQQQQPQTGRTTAVVVVDGGQIKAAPNRNQQQQQQQRQQQKQPNNDAKSSSSSRTAGVSENRSKTVWKCKKCFFRDCDRLIVLNHVKAHYRRGEFSSGGDISPDVSKQSSSQRRNKDGADGNQKNVNKTKKMVELKEANKQKLGNADSRKTTKSTPDTLLLLSTNPKSLMLYDDENFLSCPLCDVTVGSPGQLKEHMQRTHIPQETKYRCEYCPFWSEEKKAMLDHMVFAHEMDDTAEVNSADINDQTEQRDEISSNSNITYENDGLLDDRKSIKTEENCSINDTTSSIETFENCRDSNTTAANMDVVFDASEKNINMDTTVVECKPDFGEHDEDITMESSMTPSKSSEKSSYDDINAEDISCEYNSGDDCEDNERVKDDDILSKAEEQTDLKLVKIIKVLNTGTGIPSPETLELRQLFECNECWYFATNKKDMHLHKQLHVKRGALYNCAQCVYNVTKAELLYHHYRYGHMIEEPEMRYPEDSVVRAGYKDIYLKNTNVQDEEKMAETDGTIGPPMVWSYIKENIPPFARVFKCRYCPHTNRRRHNTVEHERMHSDHPEHQVHRQQQQQRVPGSSTLQSPPLHPCKRCTYVCNNAGVLASHVKVHSISYGYSIVGFYDSSIGDSMQARALEYVMELEKSLQLDNNYHNNGGSSDSDAGNQEDTKYKEIDDPELKFCPYCPARFFFNLDLQCHIRFHQYRFWKHTCDCCSFASRTQSHITAHEIVHRDEYTQRTAELLASGYPVSQQYARPLEYSESVSEDSLPCHRSPTYKVEAMETCSSDAADDQLEHGTKRPRDSKHDTVIPSLPQDHNTEQIAKRRRRSITNVVAVKTAVTMKAVSSAPIKTPIDSKAVSLKSTTDAVVNKPKNNYVRSFECDKCPGRFFKATALQYHKTLHGGTGLHHCRSCDYAVSTYGNLIRHEYVHVDLPPREKGKPVIISKSLLKSKIKRTNNSALESVPQAQASNTDNVVNEDNTIDPDLGSTMLGNPDFYYPTTIKNGMNLTRRYKCAKCPSAFDKRDQYVVHLTLHGAKDKYQCDKCDYSVRDPANFVEHRRKHARDAEMRKNHKEVVEKTNSSKSQEETTEQQTTVSSPVNLCPHDTEFRNEISDRQTAYELNTAYGATGIVNGETDTVFRCVNCPYESSSRAQLDRHMLHHQEIKSTHHLLIGSSSKRSWKRTCRFCTYRTYADADLTEHTKVHFLRSTSTIMASMAAVAAHAGNSDDVMENGDHVEFHGKRVVYHQDSENHSDKGDADPATVNDNIGEAEKEEPFFVFKDCGSTETLDESDKHRFSPDYQPPAVLIDFNDNRTTSGDIKKIPQQKQTPAFVRYIDGGKRLEFLDDCEEDPAINVSSGKTKKLKK